ncbi:MAG TPA: response regulator [Vicinamibacterales bacterium]
MQPPACRNLLARALPALASAGDVLRALWPSVRLRQAQERIADLEHTIGDLRGVIAEQAETQKILWEATTLQLAILESANCSIISTDTQGIIQTWNATAERWLGYQSHEVVGRMTPLAIHVPAEVAARAAELSAEHGTPVPPDFDALVHDARMGRIDGRDWTYVRKDGSTFPVRVSVTALRDEEGGVAGFVAVGIDLTEQRRAEAELQAARDHAIAATEAKSAFLATMTHEIRTPLSGVIGLAGLLQEKLSPGTEAHEIAGTILRSSENLLGILNDLLDFSKIEAGRLRLEEVDLDIRTVIDETFHLLGQEARRKGLRLERTIEPNVPEALRGDPHRIRQILLNLVGNALKFTAAGSVSVRVSAQPEGRDTVLMRVEVADTGTGIPPAVQARLFQSYEQAERSTARRFGGTGLGLAICRQLTGLMGGEIGVVSEEGKGSTFWFTARLGIGRRGVLPIQEPQIVDADVKPSGVPLRVLLAEDNAVNQRVATAMLHKLGHSVTVAENGRAALEALCREAFDVVLMDCQMPEMDGLEATGRIRALPGPRASVPVIALTAHASTEDRERCLNAGMDDYLTKPLRIAELRRVLGNAAARLAKPAA